MSTSMTGVRDEQTRKREKRANIIFIVVLLLFTLPGATMLTLKKLRQEEGRSMLPPGVRQAVAYMDPTPGLTPLDRFVPPVTGDWIASLTNQRRFDLPLNILVTGDEWTPTMSEAKSLQLVALDPTPGAMKFNIVGWSQRFTSAKESWSFVAKTDTGELPAEVAGIELMLMPLSVRDELKDAGFIRPPDQVIWLQVRVPGDEPVRSLELKYLGGKGLEDTLVIEPGYFTKPGEPVPE